VPRSTRGQGCTSAARNDRRCSAKETQRSEARLRRINRAQALDIEYEIFPGPIPGASSPVNGPDRFVCKYLEQTETQSVFPELGKTVEDAILGSKEMVNSTNEEQWEHCLRFAGEGFKPTRRVWRKTQRVLKAFFKRIPSGAFGNVFDAYSQGIYPHLNATKHPGYRYGELGYKTKHDAWYDGSADEDTWEKLTDLLDGRRREVEILKAGGRAKLCDAARRQSGEVGLGRLIWIGDIADVGISAPLCERCNDYFTRRHHGVGVGKRFQHSGGKSYRDYFYGEDPYTLGVGADLRRMDAGMYPRLIAAILDGLRSKFADGQASEFDELFAFIIRQHIGGRILMGDNVVLTLLTGMSSGVPFVSLVESIASVVLCVGFVAFCYGVNTVKGMMMLYEALRYDALGDDTWMTYPGRCLSRIWNVELYAQYAEAVHGFEVNRKKTVSGFGYHSFFYLSANLMSDGLKAREHQETFDRWLRPESYVHDPAVSFLRAGGLACDNPQIEVMLALRSYQLWLIANYDLTFEDVTIGRHDHEEFLFGQDARDLSELIDIESILGLYLDGRTEPIVNYRRNIRRTR